MRRTRKWCSLPKCSRHLSFRSRVCRRGICFWRVARISVGSLTLETNTSFPSWGAPCLPGFGKRGTRPEATNLSTARPVCLRSRGGGGSSISAAWRVARPIFPPTLLPRVPRPSFAWAGVFCSCPHRRREKYSQPLPLFAQNDNQGLGGCRENAETDKDVPRAELYSRTNAPHPPTPFFPVSCPPPSPAAECGSCACSIPAPSI